MHTQSIQLRCACIVNALVLGKNVDKTLAHHTIFSIIEKRNRLAPITHRKMYSKTCSFLVLDAHVACIEGSYSLNVCDGWHKSCNGPVFKRSKRACFIQRQRANSLVETIWIWIFKLQLDTINQRMINSFSFSFRFV